MLPSGHGIPPDSYEVARAVRMSMSIPYFFEPVGHNGQYFVDGGMLSNFPVWLFDHQPESAGAADRPPRFPSFGFKRVEPGNAAPSEIDSIIDFIKALVTTMLESHDKRHVEEADFLRTIAIPTVGVRTTEFTLAEQKRTRLYESGKAAAHGFLRTWDADAYIRRARPDQPGVQERRAASIASGSRSARRG